mmetsp:Transcript_38116/g.61025  ORF Transcript_38116/g.61025 Transcript_38116/m.61025 type:complete len:205 (-) Transcript_38116:155-769(-)
MMALFRAIAVVFVMISHAQAGSSPEQRPLGTPRAGARHSRQQSFESFQNMFVPIPSPQAVPETSPKALLEPHVRSLRLNENKSSNGSQHTAASRDDFWLEYRNPDKAKSSTAATTGSSSVSAWDGPESSADTAPASPSQDRSSSVSDTGTAGNAGKRRKKGFNKGFKRKPKGFGGSRTSTGNSIIHSEPPNPAESDLQQLMETR